MSFQFTENDIYKFWEFYESNRRSIDPNVVVSLFSHNTLRTYITGSVTPFVQTNKVVVFEKVTLWETWFVGERYLNIMLCPESDGRRGISGLQLTFLGLQLHTVTNIGRGTQLDPKAEFFEVQDRMLATCDVVDLLLNAFEESVIEMPVGTLQKVPDENFSDKTIFPWDL